MSVRQPSPRPMRSRLLAGAVLIVCAGLAWLAVVLVSHWLVVVPIALLKIAVGTPTTEFSLTPRSPHRDR